MRGIGDHLGARALDDDLAVVQHGDALGKAERGVHVVLDHHDGDVARDGVEQRAHGLALGLGEPGERLVEQQQLRLLRQRHGELEPAALAVGGLDHDALGAVAEPDALERLRARRRRDRGWPVRTDHGFQRRWSRPSSESTTLWMSRSRGNRVRIW